MAKTATAEPGQAMTPKQSALDRVRQKGWLEAADVAKELSFDELINSLPADQVIQVSEAGDGYHLLRGKDEKKKLVGVPFAIVDYDVNPGRFGDFATMRIKTKNPISFEGNEYSQFIVNDGSTGIARQLDDFNRNSPDRKGVIVCMRGLRVSEDYEVTETVIDGETGKQVKRAIMDPATGKPILGTTFYLDTSV